MKPETQDVFPTISAGDLDDLAAIMGLEHGAEARYALQATTLSHPRIAAVLEGLRRNEQDHLRESLRRLAGGRARNLPEGFASLLAALQLDLEFEREAAALYTEFANRAQDPGLREMILELARAEGGHIVVLRDLLKQIREGDFPVVLFCSRCGWELDFGIRPKVGAETICSKCKVRFRLTLVEGDWAAERA